MNRKGRRTDKEILKIANEILCPLDMSKFDRYEDHNPPLEFNGVDEYYELSQKKTVKRRAQKGRNENGNA